LTTALEGSEGAAPRPDRSLPPGKTRYPLYRRLGGPQGRSGQVRKISPPPGFDPRSHSLYRLRYPAHNSNIALYLFICSKESEWAHYRSRYHRWLISPHHKAGNESKGKAVPLQAWSGPEGFSKLRFPDFMTTAQHGSKVVSLTHRPPLSPGNAPGTHFC